jgi:predicted ATPase/DNA-binding SARP family transcriptional activator/DNA-binding CsgD family transcriptional regulator
MRKAASLVKLLALAPWHHLHREQAMETLWPELGRVAASNNLRQALHSARRALEPDSLVGSRYLASQDELLVLCPEGQLWVDSEAFEEAARNAHRSREPTAYEAAIDLYAGELLPGDRYEKWPEEHRRRLRETYLSLLLGLARLHEDQADYNSAAEVLRRVVSEDPIREEAHAGLMRLYALAGSKGEALAQYERLEDVLSSELGTEPSASSRALREEIAVGRFPPTDAHPFGYASEEPHVTSKHNLPASRSSFVGREREMIEVKRALAMTRLLTLTGTGGSGKTRLALEVARELVGAYTDGVWLVELAPLSEGTLVAQAVATVLGVQEQPERPLTDTLVDFLRIKQALLVLDNCEHLVDTVARLADILLNSSPHLRVLATSRESLNVEGELTWLVPSLSAPSLGDAPTVEELAGYESVRLFVERARHRNPAFSLTSENAHAVAKICGRLDGIPLAIELAAARVGLSLEQIATRLDDSLKLLTVGSRTASPRQRTLRGTLDWSYTLLSAHEQMLFGRLSIFAGGWTLEAAEVVGAEGNTEQRDTLDFLSRLVEKSLVVAEATGGGGVRYRMLELIRQYAQEKLEKGGEAEEVRRRHASFFLTLAEEAEPRLRGPEDVKWLERLETEHDNLRAALTWALEQEETNELGLRLAGALMPFWEWHGHLSEGSRWLEEALEKEGHVSPAVRAKALYAVSDMAHLQFDTDRAVAAALEGIELIAEAEIDGSLAAAFRWMLGYAARLRGDYERAQELLEENLTFSREADDKIGIANALIELGAISFLLGDHERAKEHGEEGIVLCRELGYGEGLAVHLGNLAYVYLLEGDYERAAALNEEVAVLSREREYKGGIAFALDIQGWVALLQGDHERARISYRESLTLCKELGDKMIAESSLDGLSCISAAEGASERAARLFGAAEVLGEAVGPDLMSERDALRAPYLAMARFQLDEASWQGAWEEGRAMSMEQAIRYALSEEKPIPLTSPAPKRPSSDEAPHLTRREREVAALVAQGFTSGQIASTLVVSERTVDNHVANILKKLSLHSREQIAARLAEQSPRRD